MAAEKLRLIAMSPPSAPIREVSGAFCPRPSASELPSRAQMATLMAGTDGHQGNIGSYPSPVRNPIPVQVEYHRQELKVIWKCRVILVIGSELLSGSFYLGWAHER